MKKYWVLLFLLIACPAYGATGDVASVNGKAVAGISTIAGVTGSGISTICGKNYTDGDTSCASYASSTTDADYEYCGNVDDRRYIGMTYNFTSDKTICKICFKITEVGDLNSKTVYYEIWSVSGTALNSVLASVSFSGALVDGNLLCADLSSPYTISASTDYAITASTHETDASNYFRMRSSSASTWDYGTMTRWANNKDRQAVFTKDAVFDFYAQ